MIVGVGVDMIEIDRLTRALERRGGILLDRLFTPAETAYCLARKVPGPCLAARFAAKEAVMKALGCGWGRAAWRDVEVVPAPGGAPRVVLRGGAARIARERGVESVHLSLAHGRDLAVAQAVAWGPGDAGQPRPPLGGGGA